jgi:thioester reductase-like protein
MMGDSAGMQQQLSIRQAFRGSSVLLTGCTGYVGRLVLEQLLRCCPDIAAVHVLVRPDTQRQRQGGTCRSAAAARDRVVRLLTSSGLFNEVEAAQLRKIHVVEGHLAQVTDDCGGRRRSSAAYRLT